MVVTQDQTQPGAVVDDVVRVFLSRYLWAVVALLALMLLINGVALWHSFSSLRAVALAAGRIGPRSLHERLDETGLPAEAHALVHATNGLLDRVQAALHLREEFAGNVAHELRTPLSALRVQLARVEDAGLREGLVRQVERMSHVLAQLFDLASLDGAAAAAMAPLDLSALSIDIVAELTPAILDSGRSIALADALGDAGEPLLARANRGLIEIALRNLIDNAVKHTPKGSRIEVCLERGEKGEVLLAVADDGPGIAGNEAGQLARRFWRADQRRSDGAGLGLSIVQRIASVHEGRLEVGVSRWGGALFSLVVPGLMPDGG